MKVRTLTRELVVPRDLDEAFPFDLRAETLVARFGRAAPAAVA